MTADIIPITPAPGEEHISPRPGSRADRMSRPLSRQALKALAEHHRVCTNPRVMRRIDRDTGAAEVFEIPCGARREATCKPCAERTKRLRQQQIAEGWHLAAEPVVEPGPASEEVLALIALRCQFQLDSYLSARVNDHAQVADLTAGIAEVDELLAERGLRGRLTPPAPAAESDDSPGRRRARSTRRREDVPDLPKLAIDKRTIGRTYTGPDGRVHRPSTLLTTTLPSYGPVHTEARLRRDGRHLCGCGQMHPAHDPLLGTPVDPGSYDYRAAALGAIFYAATMDRFWQNLRRAAGFNVQYAGVVEMQKRLSPHGHHAMRGTIPRRLLKAVAAATYHQVWWPSFNRPVYPVDRPPVWDEHQACYVDPTTGQPLPTWQQALADLDHPDATPAHVARLGTIDARGIEPGTKHASRAVGYITKYITKDLADDARPASDPQRDHHDRLHAALAVLPCSPTCANWLLYGVQPNKVRKNLVPGRCTGKVHQPATLGYTGRRVLISRNWTGKTLTDHRHDNRDHIHRLLAAAGLDDQDHTTDPGRYEYQLARPGDPDVPPLQHRLMHAIALRQRWRQQLDHLRATAPPHVPATAPPEPAAQAA